LYIAGILAAASSRIACPHGANPVEEALRARSSGGGAGTSRSRSGCRAGRRLRATVRSDADGMVRVPMLDRLWHWNIFFTAGSRRSKEIAWQAGEQPVLVTVQ
jgi:hypothetical protein